MEVILSNVAQMISKVVCFGSCEAYQCRVSIYVSAVMFYRCGMAV